MDLPDLEYETRRRADELQRQIDRLTNRVSDLLQERSEMRDLLQELHYQVNTILNGDDTE